MEKRVIAGFLLFFGFIFNVITIVFVILDIVDRPNPTNALEQDILNELYFTLVVYIIFSVVVLIGAMSSLMGWKWAVAMGASVICVLSFGPYFLATVIGLAALVLLALSREEFQVRIVYVDEASYGYGGQDGYYEDDGYYDDGGAYEGYDAYGQQAGVQEAPPIQLVDQYGAALEHQYDQTE
jgi:hypothetical protein